MDTREAAGRTERARTLQVRHEWTDTLPQRPWLHRASRDSLNHCFVVCSRMQARYQSLGHHDHRLPHDVRHRLTRATSTAARAA